MEYTKFSCFSSLKLQCPPALHLHIENINNKTYRVIPRVVSLMLRNKFIKDQLHVSFSVCHFLVLFPLLAFELLWDRDILDLYLCPHNHLAYYLAYLR